ncbi:S8 family peptidase [Streptomyces sp. NPDC020801]|uniref:S8 family peptidase n=1 Tax=Streptomyces sp. NPDC020801 TaxID=3365093 RepID=UPI0037BDF1DA
MIHKKRYIATLAIGITSLLLIAPLSMHGSPKDGALDPSIPPRKASASTWKQLADISHRSEPQVRFGALLSPANKSQRPVEVIVGLKSPGSRRGVWKGRILISPTERDAVESELAHMPGVSVLERDELPAVQITLYSPATFERLRRQPWVDYVEPAYASAELSSIGCTAPPPISNSTLDSSGDILPWNFPYHRIPEAWRRIASGPHGGPGQNVTIGVVDTGILQGNTQLTMPQFAAGQSSGRQVINIATPTIFNPYTTCDHGNRVSALIGAPRDGINMEGIAWKSNLINVASHTTVVVGHDEALSVVDGIRMAHTLGAQIITMAFGNHVVLGNLYLVGDTIRYEYYRTDLRPVLFVGAAGTTVCPFGATAYPGYLDEVIQVAGASEQHTPVYGESCYGESVDIAAVVGLGGIETAGAGPDQYLGLGSSSGATATIAGILALIWSEHPTWSRDKVRDRLYASAQGYRDPEMGWGVPDAFRAVGGLASLSINGPKFLDELSQPYMLSANTGFAEGPFSYLWSTGETTPTIHGIGPAKKLTPVTRTLRVTDTRDGTTLASTFTLRPEPTGRPCAREESDARICDH